MIRFDEHQKFLVNKALQFKKDGKHLIEFDHDFPIKVDCYHFYDSLLAPSYHDYLEILYVYEGKGIYSSVRNSIHFSAGDILVVPKEFHHRFSCYDKQTFKVVALFFLPDFLCRAGSPTQEFQYIRFFNQVSSIGAFKKNVHNIDQIDVHQKIQEIYDEYYYQTGFYYLRIRNLLRDLILVLMKCFKEEQPEIQNKIVENINNLGKIEDLLIYIENNLNENISLQKAAEMSCLSPSHFCKVFKSVLGVTYKQYVLLKRIDKSKMLLTSTEKSIAEIAFESGFESVSYFFRVFKKYVNTSPSLFRVQ